MIDTNRPVWDTLFRCLAELPDGDVARVLNLHPEQARRAQILAREYVVEKQRRQDEEYIRRLRKCGRPASHEEEELA